jgi:hypothetical protein
MSKIVKFGFRTTPLLFIIGLMLLTDGHSAKAAAEVRGDIAGAFGYRVDTVDWNIAGDNSGHDPNILSELSWRDLQIYQVGLTGRAESVHSSFAPFSPYLRGAVSYGWIVSGKNQDSDYLGDNRTLEFSRSVNKADAGSVFDLSLACGGKLHFRDRRYTLSPLLGFSYYQQNLTMSDGYQTIDYPTSSFLGPIPGLQSTYDTAWYGPWLGLDTEAVVSRVWKLSAGIEWHQVTYQAEANWNLRSDLAHPKSFEHSGQGYGLICRLGSTYMLTSRLELTAIAELRDFAIRNGVDRVFLADGQQGTSRLNEVNWGSKQLMAGVLYRY